MAKKKILIIEDEKGIAEDIAVRLEVEGFQVVNAYDGKTGVDNAREKNPDLILLDVLLPKIDGFEVCKILKSSPKTEKIPILMLTSLSAVGDVEKAFDAGVNDYLTKPFEYDRLLKKIRKLLPS